MKTIIMEQTITNFSKSQEDVNNKLQKLLNDGYEISELEKITYLKKVS